MNNGLTGDPVSKALSFALNGLSRRQQAVSNNVANVDTPGFQTSNVPFESQLKAAMSKSGDAGALLVTHPVHMQRDGISRDGVSLGEPQVVTSRGTAGRLDQNSVDIEREMFQLADTTIRYQTMARVVTERLGWLRTVIAGGR